MPNQKGSLKDRLRSWNLYFKYKVQIRKKKKEEKRCRKKMERELKKRLQIAASGKYYSKPKVIVFTIIGIFLGVFESKNSKQSKVVDVENKISKLENNCHTLTPNEKIDLISEIEKAILKLRTKNQFNDDIKTKIKNCESKLEAIKENGQQKDIQTEEEASRKGLYTPVLEIKVLNKEIKECQKKLKEIDFKIKNTTDYNSFYELEFSIKQIKQRVSELLIKYNNLRELPGFDNLENIVDIKFVDNFNLRFDGFKMNEQIKACNLYLDNIENIKKNKLNKKEKNDNYDEKKKNDIESKYNEQKKLKKEDKKIDNKLLEIKLADKIVLDAISIERKNLEKFKRSIIKMGVKYKRKTIFYCTKNILSSIINFGLSLFPLSLFENKFIGDLTSGIMINNSLRSVRKVLNPELEIIYILYRK